VESDNPDKKKRTSGIKETCLREHGKSPEQQNTAGGCGFHKRPVQHFLYYGSWGGLRSTSANWHVNMEQKSVISFPWEASICLTHVDRPAASAAGPAMFSTLLMGVNRDGAKSGLTVVLNSRYMNLG